MVLEMTGVVFSWLKVEEEAARNLIMEWMDQSMDLYSRCNSMADDDSDTILGVDLSAGKEFGRSRKQLQNSVREQSP